MHKIICTITLILLIIPTNHVKAQKIYTNYNNINITQGEYNNLLKLGFTKDEIAYMNEEEFSNNKDINSNLVSQTEQYYKTTTITKNGNSSKVFETLTEHQYKEELDRKNNYTISNYGGIVETEYKHMHTSIIQLDEYQYRYKVTLTWLKIPKIRSYDIIAIGLQPAYVKINSSIYAKQNYTYKNGTTASSITCIPIENKNGGSAIIKLPTGNITALSSYLYFNVRKANDNNAITHMNASGDYAHAIKRIKVTKAIKHTINHSKGIELNRKIQKYYDGINIATASWYGIW